LKVAIVHEWLANMGGSEKVVLALHQLFPDAPIYTTVFNPANLPDEFKSIDVRTSFIQRLPQARTKYQRYLPFMPMAFEQFDLTGYDLVLTSNHACAKGVVIRPETLNICYCHTPMRYAWGFYHEYMEREKVGRFGRLVIPPLMTYLRMWDRLAADRVDYFVANSTTVAARIAKFYRRDSVVIHPPVDVANIIPLDEQTTITGREASEDHSLEHSNSGDFYLVVSRLVPYKRVDIAVEAFTRLGLPLVVIGDGSERARLEAMAGKTVRFLGRQPDEVVSYHYARCKAFIFPGEEDFGITPVEAQAAGRPVIAFGRGGATDSVLDGVTGVFFGEQSVEALIRAVERYLGMSFDHSVIRKQAEGFSEEVFAEKIANFIREKMLEHKARLGI
jgi:glycosyltransferase involved in cell wall biosynthesis